VTRLASMPGIRAISGALAVAACAATLSACGGDDEGGPIPQEDGELLIGQLDDIQTLVEQGSCAEAQQVALAFAETVNGLPAEVDGELRDGLVQASGNLEALTGNPEQCQETGTTGETGELPPETTEETTTPETTEETTTEEPPPDEDDEGGGPPEDTPGQGDPGGDDEGGGSIGGDDSSGGIGSDG
jgi:hypothetical protein